MTELLFTTKDVADMLRVDKSTVKRWTDEGKLRCFRTPGGHRKFRAEDLYQFMAEYNYAVSPSEFFPRYASDETIIRGMIAGKEFNVLDSVCFSAAIKGNKDELLRLFSEAYRNGMSLQLIFDEVLRPSVKKVFDLHQSGKLQLSEKQLALTSLSNAIVLLTDVITRPVPDGRRIVCAMVEHDFEDLDLKALNILLESQGAEVLNLGPGCPASSVAQLIRQKQPHLVFLLASSPHPVDEVVSEHHLILSELHPLNGKLIIGGSGYAPILSEPLLEGLYDRYCSTFKEFALLRFPAEQPKKKEP